MEKISLQDIYLAKCFRKITAIVFYFLLKIHCNPRKTCVFSVFLTLLSFCYVDYGEMSAFEEGKYEPFDDELRESSKDSKFHLIDK